MARQAYQSFLQPQSPEQYQDVFNKSVVDPAMMQYEQRVLPSIQQRFVDANAGSSSALNQALAQSAGDLTTQLGSQYADFFNRQQANQLAAQSAALSGLSGLAGRQTFQPMIGQSGGILGPLIGGFENIGSSYMMSSEKVKENVKPFTKIGLNQLKRFKVKQYDYIEKVGGQKNKIGLISEDLPKELTAEKDGILHVDLYALMSVMINAIQELDQKIKRLEDS
jgi:hypothetical protein